MITKYSALWTAVCFGALKTVRMMVELKPQCLQEKRFVEDFNWTKWRMDHGEAKYHIIATLIEARKNPFSLMVLCRAKIIQSLRYKPFEKVPKLPLPQVHKDFLMLKNVEGF